MEYLCMAVTQLSSTVNMVFQAVRVEISEWICYLVPQDLSYNMSFFVNILSCNQSFIQSNAETETKQEEGTISSIFNYFYASEPQGKEETSSVEGDKNCHSLLNLDGIYIISPQHILMVVLVLVLLIFFLIFCFHLLSKKSKKRIIGAEIFTEADQSQTTSLKDGLNKTAISINQNKNSDTENRELASPLTMKLGGTKTSGNLTVLKPELEAGEIFEATVGRFLKDLDKLMALDGNSGGGEAAASASLVGSSSSNSTVTGPNLGRRRTTSRQRNLTYTYGDADVSTLRDRYLHSWSMFEKFSNAMNWTFPDSNLHDVNIPKVSEGNYKLYHILQFLHQNSSMSLRQWQPTVHIVNYSLFILEKELQELSQNSGEILKFSRFESFGSAADGTHVGSSVCFDVLAIFKVSDCSEMNILHANASVDIPPGHTIIGVKPTEGSHILKTSKCVKKYFLEGFYRFCISPDNVETFLESNIKTVLLKLNGENKSRMDRLPYKLSLSPNKELTITIDTRLLQGLGLGIPQIQIKFCPSIALSDPSFCLLPTLYAVPSYKRKKNEPPSSPVTRTFRRFVTDASLHVTLHIISHELLWNINVTRVESMVLQHVERKFLDSEVISQHRLCIRILKALFADGSKNSLLNKGEISPYIIKTVVSFLLQESSASAWSLDQIPDRVSDAVHFLRSSFENIWLPSFIVHNPHLQGQMPGLKVLAPLIEGRQHNLLFDLTQDAAMKKLEYIELRLQKTGLVDCVKDDYSPNMWEYEFFMFG